MDKRNFAGKAKQSEDLKEKKNERIKDWGDESRTRRHLQRRTGMGNMKTGVEKV